MGTLTHQQVVTYAASEVTNDSSVSGTYVKDALETLNAKSTGNSKNLLWAGDFRLNPSQEQITINSTSLPNINSSGVYCADGMIYQAAAANVVSMQRSQVSENINAFRGFIQTANNKFGYLFPINSLTTEQLLEVLPKALSIRLRARRLNGSFDFKVALVEWDGAVDTLTRSIVSSWNADGTDPTLTTNWSYITGTIQSSVSLDLTYDNYDFNNISIPTGIGANNIGVFLYTDNAPTVASTMFEVQYMTMNLGAEAVDTEIEEIGEYFNKCNMLYEQSYEIGIDAGATTNSLAIQSISPILITTEYVSLRYRAAKIKSPTVTILATDQATYTLNKDKITVPGTGTVVVNGVTDNGKNGFSRIILNNAVNADTLFEYHWVADARP